jgi:phosphatidate phosphatase LPIN
MEALILWRDKALRESEIGIPSPALSPAPQETPLVSEDEGDEEESLGLRRSKSEPPQKLPSPIARKPTSTSWVKWWSSSHNDRQKEASDASSGKGSRPVLRGSSSSPLDAVGIILYLFMFFPLMRGLQM